MALMSGFNDLSSDGYRPSARGLSAHRDIMDQAPSPSTTDLFNTSSLKSAFASNDPLYGQKQSFTESLIQGNTRTQSLMDTMRPDQSYQAAKVDTGSMMRDANKAVTDGANVSRQADMGMKDTKENIANFQQDFKQAQNEALDALKEAAIDMDIDPRVAVDSLVPDTAPSKTSAMAYVGSELAFGGGTLSTFAKTIFASQELSKQEKELPAEKQKALLEEARERLVSSSQQQNDTRANPSAGSSVPLDVPKQSEVAWDNMEADDLAELLAADPEGEGQPEMEALRQQEHDLNMVQDNHRYVKEHYADTLTSDKMYASMETGNDAMRDIVFDAQEIDVQPKAATPQYQYGPEDVEIAGSSLSGITMMASDTSFDSKSVETVLNMSKVDAPEATRQLDADISMQMRV